MAHLDDNPEAVDLSNDEAAAEALAQHIEPELEEQEDPAIEGDEESKSEEEELEAEADDETDEDDEQDEEELEQPAIDPPASLKAEEQEVFAKLQPEAQEFVKEFAVRRDQEIQRGLEKANAAQEQVKTESAAQVLESKKQFANKIVEVAQAFLPQAPDPQLKVQNPALFIQLSEQYDAEFAQRETMVQQAVAIFQEAQDGEGELQNQFVQQRDKDLLKIPDFADESKRDASVKAALSLAEEMGMNRDDVIRTGDAADFNNLLQASRWKEKADKWDAAQSQKMQRVRKAKTAKPNAAQPKSSGKRANLRKAQKNLAATGSDDAALAVFEQIGV